MHLASANARFGIRVNAIMPGLLDTPMAIESISAASGTPVDEVRADRDRVVPLNRRMGTAWDCAHAALFLASDEAGLHHRGRAAGGRRAEREGRLSPLSSARPRRVVAVGRTEYDWMRSGDSGATSSSSVERGTVRRR